MAIRPASYYQALHEAEVAKGIHEHLGCETFLDLTNGRVTIDKQGAQAVLKVLDDLVATRGTWKSSTEEAMAAMRRAKTGL